MSDSPRPNKWAIVAAASITHALHAAAVYIAPATLLSPMRLSLGLTLSQITLPLQAYRILQAILLLPAGALLDSVGPQRLLRISMLAAGLAAPLLSVVNSLPQLVAVQMFLALTKLCGGLSAMLMVVTDAFGDGKNQATATGVLLAGYSLAGFIAPALLGALEPRLGWRLTCLIMSLAFSVIAVPLTFRYLRESPETYAKRQPIGAIARALFTYTPVPSDPAPNDTASATATSTESLLTPAYLLIALIVAAFSFSMTMILDHMIVYLTEDVALSFERATQLTAVLSLIALLAKLVVGPLGDRFSQSGLMACFGALAGAASLLLLDIGPNLTFQATKNVSKILTFVPLYAIGYAAVFSLTTSSLAEFDPSSLGLRANCNVMLLFLIGSAGSAVASYLRGQSGTYAMAFVWNAAVWIVVVLAAGAKYLLVDRNRSTKTPALRQDGADE